MKEHKYGVLSSIGLSFFCLHSFYICQILPSIPCFLPLTFTSGAVPFPCSLHYVVLCTLLLSCLLALSFPTANPASLLFFSHVFSIISFSFPSSVLSVACCSYSSVFLRASVLQQDHWARRAGNS